MWKPPLLPGGTTRTHFQSSVPAGSPNSHPKKLSGVFFDSSVAMALSRTCTARRAARWTSRETPFAALFSLRQSACDKFVFEDGYNYFGSLEK